MTMFTQTTNSLKHLSEEYNMRKTSVQKHVTLYPSHVDVLDSIIEKIQTSTIIQKPFVFYV